MWPLHDTHTHTHTAYITLLKEMQNMQILTLPVRLSNKTLKLIYNSLLRLCNGPGVSPTVLNWGKKKKKNQGTKNSMRNYKSCPSKSERASTAGEQFYSSHEIPPLPSHSRSQTNILLINISQKWMADEFALIN